MRLATAWCCYDELVCVSQVYSTQKQHVSPCGLREQAEGTQREPACLHCTLSGDSPARPVKAAGEMSPLVRKRRTSCSLAHVGQAFNHSESKSRSKCVCAHIIMSI